MISDANFVFKVLQNLGNKVIWIGIWIKISNHATLLTDHHTQIDVDQMAERTGIEASTISESFERLRERAPNFAVRSTRDIGFDAVEVHDKPGDWVSETLDKREAKEEAAQEAKEEAATAPSTK